MADDHIGVQGEILTLKPHQQALTHLLSCQERCAEVSLCKRSEIDPFGLRALAQLTLQARWREMIC